MPAAKRGPSTAVLALNLAIIYVIWGSTYFGIAIAIETMPPFLMASIRFAIAGVILVAFDLLRHPEARRMPTRRQVIDTIIVGGLLLGIGNGFVTFGQLTVPSGIAAILIAMIPLWFALFGWLYFRERLPRIVGLAIVIGFAGTALLVAPTGEGANTFDLLGIVILLLAPIGWAHGSIYSARKAKLPPSPLTASGLQMLAGAGVTFIEALLIDEPSRFHPETFSSASLIAVVYLIVFGSMVAFTTYAWLLRNAPLSLVSTYAYVNPVVAVALGTIFLAEPISLRTILASAIILTAVAIIVTARGRLGSSRPAEPAEPAQSVVPASPVVPHGVATPSDAPGARAAPAGVRPAIPPQAPSG
jgi:drug/metabolite transporter (DMT)-like permease